MPLVRKRRAVSTTSSNSAVPHLPVCQFRNPKSPNATTTIRLPRLTKKSRNDNGYGNVFARMKTTTTTQKENPQRNPTPQTATMTAKRRAHPALQT